MSSLLAGPGVASAAHTHSNFWWKRQTMILSRWLHIYLSMASFGILFFFAVTGLTLNHAEWFASQVRTVQLRGAMDAKYLAHDVDKLNVVEYLRTKHAIHGAVKDFRVEDSTCSVAFKGPGYSADVFIDRATGRYELTESRMGFVAVLNDLHKGRDSGAAWAVIIDISAVLMTLVSLTGLLLIFFLQKKRLSGLLAACAGAVLCYLAYLAWVP
ncbi:MAG TPA: PepSY-associated TM helix domain-containing protein [Candidatus Sulfopaludibacter sp.]|jgi:hypothetical protein|nr:PepSY-associated TM helix domain-containing protein [Candidatus Sulfopaludibacter sp.]